jgi:transposase
MNRLNKYEVKLSDEQRKRLEKAISSGQSPARELAHARVLLEASEGKTDEQVALAVRVSPSTVARVRKQFATAGIDPALRRRPQPPRPEKRKLDGTAEAKLVMLACSSPPEGHEHWTLDLLADRMVRLKYVPTVSRDTVSRALKKTNSSPG